MITNFGAWAPTKTGAALERCDQSLILPKTLELKTRELKTGELKIGELW